MEPACFARIKGRIKINSTSRIKNRRVRLKKGKAMKLCLSFSLVNPHSKGDFARFNIFMEVLAVSVGIKNLKTREKESMQIIMDIFF